MSTLIAHAVSTIQMPLVKFPDLQKMLPSLSRSAFWIGLMASVMVWAFYTLN